VSRTDPHISPTASGEQALRVLLVEDDAGDALLVEELLGDRGDVVALTRAHTLAEAEALTPAGLDCVLLDLNLPDATGFDALTALRSAPEAPAILVLTGLDDERRGVAAVSAGAQDYLVKGQVDGALLVRSIRYAVERRRAERAQQQLHAARLHAQENARLERGLLPDPLVDDARLELSSHYRPGRRRALLGGDFFDAVERADGTLHAVIGDVCGHGPDEAALGVALRIAWRTLVLGGRAPDDLLATLDAVLVAERQDASVFTTLCMLTIAPGRRAAELRVAGHPAPLLLTGTDVQVLPAPYGGPPLGVVDEAVWPARRVELPATWSLLLYTDGLNEGRAGAGPERLGEDGLLRLVRAAQAGGSADGALLAEVVERAEALNGGPLLDDVAALLITRREA
jgi:serine phosphatase RsbU (regulator of sigma subunit)